jgi:hypothetical protein
MAYGFNQVCVRDEELSEPTLYRSFSNGAERRHAAAAP